MTTTLYDSTRAGDIPADAPAVAGYVDGAYAWTSGDWQRFSAVPRITITTRPPGVRGARVCDVENGDFTFDQGAVWAKSEVDAGRRPTLYFSVSNYDAITTALHNVGLTWAQVDAWGAHYGAPAVIPAGYSALQYADPNTSGGHYDLSVANTSWLLRGAPAPPTTTEGADMAAYDPISGGSWFTEPDGAVFAFDGAPYLGGLNNHPEWQAGAGQANGPALGIAFWKGDGTDENGNGYVIVTKDAAGQVHPYRFPRSGVYAS